MAYGATLTLPTITGSHTDLPVVLKTADFPATAVDGGANSLLNGGGDLRAYTDDTKATQLALDVVTFVAGGTPDIVVWVKVPTAATGNTVYIEADATETVQPATTGTYGRNAVWADYNGSFHFDTLEDSTGNGVSAVLNGAASISSGELTTGSGASATQADSNQFEGQTSFSAHFVANTGTLVMAGVGSPHRLVDKNGGVLAIGLTTNKFRVWNQGWSDIAFSAGNNTDVDLWLTYDGAAYKFYNNGSLIGTVAKTGLLGAGIGDLVIGNSKPTSTEGNFWPGTIKDFTHSTAALSADWVATSYDNQSSILAWTTSSAWVDSGGTASATLSGSATASITETDINNGGKQIILDLLNTVWVAAGAAFDAIRQDILDGLVSDQNEQYGWNNEVIAAQPVSAVVRTSDTRVTITLVAA